MKQRVLVVLLSAGCAHTGTGGTACYDDPSPAYFAALPAAAVNADGSMNVTKLLAAAQADKCPLRGAVSLATWQSDCAAFLTQLINEHCRPRIDAYCDEKCPADAVACKTGNPRRKLEDVCVPAALPAFVTTVPYCKGLTLQGNNTFAMPDAGAPTCP